MHFWGYNATFDRGVRLPIVHFMDEDFVFCQISHSTFDQWCRILPPIVYFMDAPLTLEESSLMGKSILLLGVENISAIPLYIAGSVPWKLLFFSFLWKIYILNRLEHRMISYSFKSSLRDEYKEFEKLIQEDLREVDDRLEEEEVMIIIFFLLYIWALLSNFWDAHTL